MSAELFILNSFGQQKNKKTFEKSLWRQSGLSLYFCQIATSHQQSQIRISYFWYCWQVVSRFCIDIETFLNNNICLPKV